MTSAHESDGEWSNHYRGYRLQTNPDGDVWWQAYQGTDRLYLDPTPDELVESLLDLKRLGGRVRITEGNEVITRVEDGDDYKTQWVGTVSLSGELVPADDPSFSIPLQPDDVEPGDLWPSVYDGAKYSFGPGVDHLWWANPDTHKRHPVQENLDSDLVAKLTRYKPQGGSLRVTPWHDVLTLVDLDRLPPETQDDFDALPRVVKNLVALRRERGGVRKLPIYVGRTQQTPFSVEDPRSLTDPFDDDGGVDKWLDSLGESSETDPSEHTVGGPPVDDTSDGGPTIPDDDPVDW